MDNIVRIYLLLFLIILFIAVGFTWVYHVVTDISKRIGKIETLTDRQMDMLFALLKKSGIEPLNTLDDTRD